MMNKFALLVLFSTINLFAIGQDIPPAPADKAVVYIVKTRAIGSIINFTFFDGDKPIGRFHGRNHLRYECEPGMHYFWGISRNKSYVQGNLKAGEIYMIEAVSVMGRFILEVNLFAVDPKLDRTKPLLKIISNKEPSKLDASEIIEIEKYRAGAIKQAMKKIAKKKKRRGFYQRLYSKKAFSADDLVLPDK